MSINLGTQPAPVASVRVDAVCAQAVDLAREVLVTAVGEPGVGEYLAVVGLGERMVEHRFTALHPGYLGWYWSVTVVRAPRAKQPTVCETVLLPTERAVLAPTWLPWNQRLRPGDVGVGDLLPSDADDERLMPAFLVDDDEITEDDPTLVPEQVADTVALGRPRVMSPVGREQAAQRWYDAEAGPTSPLAKAAPGRCGTCGFYLRLAGSLSAVFGACGNVYAPDDGKVVSADHGCGAHSEAAAQVG
ncbi:MAG: DUF3027 domain-containing protein [Mycobacteriales bacterium]